MSVNEGRKRVSFGFVCFQVVLAYEVIVLCKCSGNVPYLLDIKNYRENGVLRKLKHIFPNTYQRINSICSPAKVGLVVIDLITSPVVSWRGWGDTPPSTAAQLSFFA